MRPRARLLPIAFLFVLLALAAGATGVATAIPDGQLVSDCAGVPGEDFAPPEHGNETIGWFDGYWYNESLDIEVGDNLSEHDLEHLSARTAARVEALRCLPFEESPPIEVIDRDAFADQQEELVGTVGESRRQFDNQQFETLLTIGSDVDSIEVRREAREVTSGGFYDFERDRIVVISDDPDALTIDEAILAHELGHALQDQHFNLSRYERDTMDRDKAILGVIEGDARWMELAYRERCEEAAWGTDCLEAAGGGAGGPPPNWAQYFISFHPYSDGPTFIQAAFDRAGWQGVNALYDEMPNATIHTIDPSTYGEIAPEQVPVPDRSDAAWERVSVPDSPDYNVIGRAGMSAILMGQSAEATGAERILSLGAFQNLADDGLSLNQTDPFDYDLDATEGWRGDRLYVYTDGEGGSASVWRSTWAGPGDAAAFLAAYKELAAYQGGERVPGHEHTWRFSGSSEFDMVVHLSQNTTELRIVTAPTLDDLSAVHGRIDLDLDDDEPSDHPDDRLGPSDPALGHDTGTDDAIPENTSDDGDDVIPGFGVLAAIAALAWIAATRRR